MKLYAYDNLPDVEVVHEFKNNSWRSFFYVTLIFMAITAFVATPKGGADKSELAVVPGAVTLFFGGYCILRFRQHRLHYNWALRLVEGGLFINLRSHYHHFFPANTPCVLYLEDGEIAAVGKTHIARKIPLAHGEAKEHHSYIDIYLHHDDLEGLDAAIKQERRIALEYSSRKIAPHYPAQVIDPPGVRVLWEWIEPRENKALMILADRYPLGPDQKLNTKAWDKMTPEERDGFIRELWESGQVEDAARLIKEEHKLTPRQARDWIEEHIEPLVG